MRRLDENRRDETCIAAYVPLRSGGSERVGSTGMEDKTRNIYADGRNAREARG